MYEAEHRGWTDDLDLYRALASRAGGRVLELGCGSGRVAMALAEAGHEVHGVDTSGAMLAIARNNLDGRGLPVTFSSGRHAATFAAGKRLAWRFARLMDCCICNPRMTFETRLFAGALRCCGQAA